MSAVEVSGSGEACAIDVSVNGTVPPNNAVYECPADNGGSTEHCQNGICPSPCYSIHTTQGIAHNRTGMTNYERACIRRFGDGISADSSDNTHPVQMLSSYAIGIYDDIFECDWGCNMDMHDTLIESAFSGMAMKPRGHEPRDVTGYEIRMGANRIQMVGFKHAHKVQARPRGSVQAGRR